MKNDNELYIYMDDSGKLNFNEKTCIYGGLFFYSSKEFMNFINKYKNIIKNIKCNYCNHCCDNNCIEIKGTTKIKNSDKRRIMNLIKKEKNFAIFINNTKVFDNILKDKSSRGRFCDYAQKRIIKEIVLYSIRLNLININEPLILNIKIDQSTTKSNGYYNLKDSIYEELTSGVYNFDYSKVHSPILKNKLDLKLKTYNSKNNFGIQSADMLAHYLHGIYNFSISNSCDMFDNSIVNVSLFIP